MFYQLKLAVELIMNITFSMTTGVPKLENKLQKHSCAQSVTGNKCFPHQCSAAYSRLEGKLMLILGLHCLNPYNPINKDKHVVRVTPKYTDQNFIWHALMSLKYERDYIKRLLHGVNFKLEIKELKSIAYRIHSHGSWRILIPDHNEIVVNCHHSNRCDCNITTPDSVWYDMSLSDH